MNYEEKYNAALEHARAEILANPGLRKMWEDLFPELRESEDERIRKGLVKLLTVASEAYLVESTGIKKDSYLAYLEKQKEQKLVEWSEEDKWKRKELIQYLEEKGDYRTVWMTWLKSLRPSWKPSEEQMESLLWCTAHLGGADHRVLAELYEQLKKL